MNIVQFKKRPIQEKKTMNFEEVFFYVLTNNAVDINFDDSV